jgi:hypothetical protein
VLRRYRLKQHLHDVRQGLDEESRAADNHYLDVAQGWVVVAIGGFLLALSEAGSLGAEADFPEPGRWTLVLIPIIAITIFLATRVHRRRPGSTWGASGD